jgi:glyceraldehyde-3-phosphate dehydrogenase (NADP+)
MEGQTSRIFYYFVNRRIFTNYFRIDSFMGEKEGLEAVEAADAAYNNGQGLWPTMSVKDRLNV